VKKTHPSLLELVYVLLRSSSLPAPLSGRDLPTLRVGLDIFVGVGIANSIVAMALDSNEGVVRSAEALRLFVVW
jgi:hypothetical protein